MTDTLTDFTQINHLNLEQRIQRLESIEAIRALKARYLAACDAKDTALVKDCFAPGKVHIDYGPVGVFDSREGLIKVFQELGCHPHIIDLHHGQNAQISILNERSAQATWGLYFHQIDQNAQRVTQLGGTYQDEYVLTDQGWVISSTVFRAISNFCLQLNETQLSVLMANGPQ